MTAPSQDANRHRLKTGTTCHELLDESAHSHKYAFVWNCRTIRRCRGERDTLLPSVLTDVWVGV